MSNPIVFRQIVRGFNEFVCMFVIRGLMQIIADTVDQLLNEYVLSGELPGENYLETCL